MKRKQREERAQLCARHRINSEEQRCLFTSLAPWAAVVQLESAAWKAGQDGWRVAVWEGAGNAAQEIEGVVGWGWAPGGHKGHPSSSFEFICLFSLERD